MHFPPCFRFPPYFRKVFLLSGKFMKFYLFPTKFPIFIRQNFWRPFFLVDHKFRISPLFCLFYCISPLISENLLFPLLFKISPLFSKNSTAFYILYVSFPPLLWPWCIYASPNARTGRPCIRLKLLIIDCIIDKHIMCLYINNCACVVYFVEANLMLLKCNAFIQVRISNLICWVLYSHCICNVIKTVTACMQTV